MGVKVKDNISNMLLNAKKELPKTAEQLVSRIAQSARIDIITRTKSGRDVNNQAFKPYSKWYIQYKKSKGKKTSPVNLEFEGTMLQAIQARTEKRGDKVIGILNFNNLNEREKALKHINGDDVPVRNFWGISKSFEAKIKKIIDSVNIKTIFRK